MGMSRTRRPGSDSSWRHWIADAGRSAVHMPIKLDDLVGRRKERHMSITDVSNASGLSREMIYRIERGDNVTIKSLQAYCLVLGLQVVFIDSWDHS